MPRNQYLSIRIHFSLIFIFSFLLLTLSGCAVDPALLQSQNSANGAAGAFLDEAVATVNTGSLRVRREPDPESPIVAGIKEGEIYKVSAMSSDGIWIRLDIPDAPAERGWVSANFIQMEGDITNVSIIGPDGAEVAELDASAVISTTSTITGTTETIGTTDAPTANTNADIDGAEPANEGVTEDAPEPATDEVVAVVDEAAGEVATDEVTTDGVEESNAIDNVESTASDTAADVIAEEAVADEAESTESATPTAEEIVNAALETASTESPDVEASPAEAIVEAPTAIENTEALSATVEIVETTVAITETVASTDTVNNEPTAESAAEVVVVEEVPTATQAPPTQTLPTAVPATPVPEVPPTATPDPNATPAPGMGIVTTNGIRLRVRSAPTVESEIVAHVLNGESYKIVEIGQGGQWLKIALAEGEGWVSSQFVRVGPLDLE